MIRIPRRSQLRRLKRRLLLELDRPTKFGKTDLIHLIAKRLNLRNYLELCTTTTGNFYREVDQSRFKTSRRLMYNCPPSYDDGLPIQFRSADFDIKAATAELKANSDHVDICLVDGWHTYDCAIRDLTTVYNLLADGGVIVVHDCLPCSESIASPVAIPGEWCGVSYKAFLDFVIDRNGLDYYTVNIDCGCGIIVKKRTFDHSRLCVPAPDQKLIADWLSFNDDYSAAFQFFSENQERLLRLVSAKTFVRRFSKKVISPISSHSPLRRERKLAA